MNGPRRDLLVWLVCCLAIAWCGRSSAAAPKDTKPRVLYLHTEFLPYKHLGEDTYSVRLSREVVRQSLLLAARDEMGLITCDETLHETPPDDAHVIHLMLTERVGSEAIWKLRLIVHEEGKEINQMVPLWIKSFKSAVGGVRVYGFLTPKLEEDSRGGFLKALRLAGLGGKKPAKAKPRPPSDEIKNSLLQVNFVAQYGAVRSAHQAIAARGETPEWLGVLVRGYANLAMLTQHQWNSASEVFTARAWLYAQRMVAGKRARDWALWHRAYAWALGGTLQHALEDLERLERRKNAAVEGKGRDKPFDPPAWTKLIEPYAMCDRAALKEVGQEDKALGAWATRLGFQLTSAYRQPQWMYDAAIEVAEVCPTAYGVYAELAHHGQALGVVRTGARLAPTMFGLHSPADLSAVPGMPKDIQSVLSTKRLGSGPQGGLFGDPNPDDPFSAVPTYVARHLRQKSKQKADGDISWSALAFLLEEEQFVQAANYLSVSTNATEYSLTEEVDSVLPLLKDHRYAIYLESYRYNTRHQREALQQLLTNIVIEDPRLNMSDMFSRLWWVEDSEKKRIGYHAYNDVQRNFTMAGILEHVYTKSPVWAPGDLWFAELNVREFSGVAPHSETRIRMALQAAGDPTVAKLRKWEGELREDPTAFARLARHYWDKEDPESAIRCFKKSLALLPTIKSAGDLAGLYLRQNDRQKWEQTLLQFLESEDLGLEHGVAHQRLAQGHADWGDWEKAKPHALKAAQTWSGWGLETASYVCEGGADWKESEKWIREMATSYPSYSGSIWYSWCRRTGRGDLEAARKLAQEFHSAPVEKPTVWSLIELGAFYLMEDKPRDARQKFRESFDLQPAFSTTYMIAQLSRKLKDEQSRKDAIAAMEEAFKKLQEDTQRDTKFDEVGLAILELLKTGDASGERLEKIDRLLAPLVPNVRSTLAYFVGQELAALGQMKGAQKYWRRALVLFGSNTLFATLAGRQLSRLHGTSRPDGDIVDKNAFWPAAKEEKKKHAEEGPGGES